jgi:phosphoglycerate dehydrogenase-like enzyme
MLDLQGGTILVFGLGGNGTAIAERARAFGMRIIATSAASHLKPVFVDYVGAPAELGNPLSSADVVVNTYH